MTLSLAIIFRFSLLLLISRLTMFFMFLLIKLMFTLNHSYRLNLFFYNPSWILYLTHSTFQGSIEAIWSNIILETGPIMCCIISLVVSIILESIRESQLKLVVVCVCVYSRSHVQSYYLKKIQDNSYKIIAHQFLPFLSLKRTFPFSQANSLHCTIT